MNKILFTGLGRMGLPMAKNLLKGNFEVHGFDVSKQNLERAKELGIKPYSEAEDVNYDLYYTIVPDAKALKNFYLSEYGPLKNAKKNAMLIDSSTIGPQEALKFHAICQKRNLQFIDAPVSGGVIGAENATLSIMVGADNENIFKKAENYLKYMGANVMNCKKTGMGQTAKICNNLALAIQMRSIAEALNLGRNLGMDLKVLSDIISKSTSNCWSLTCANPAPDVDPNSPSSKNYDAGFSSNLMAKDLQIAIDCADEFNSNVEFGKASLSQYEKILSQGKGDKNFGIIYQDIKNK